MVVPPIVLVVPLFEMMVDLGQLNTYRSVIVVYTGILLPFSTFLLASFFRTTPRDLLDAARIDGAGHVRHLVVDRAAAVRSRRSSPWRSCRRSGCGTRS